MEFDINSKINTFKHKKDNKLIYNEFNFEHKTLKYIYVIDGKISIESTLTDKEIDIVK